MDKKQKAPGWILGIFLGCIVIGVLVFTIIFGINLFNRFTANSSAQVNSKTCQNWDGDQLELELVPGKWTCWVNIPPYATTRIHSDVDATIKFADGYTSKVGPDINKWEGLRKTIFQFTSSEPGTITITIER